MQFQVKYQGKNSLENWPHFAWLVIINGKTFHYKTGVGHATPKNKTDRRGYYSGTNKKPDNSISDDNEWVHIPNERDVLECLFADASCGSMSFNEFCDNCGYSNDSIEAFNTYRACEESAKNLRTALGSEYENQKNLIESQL